MPWCVVGGWSIDLFLGRETRAHEDIEIEVVRDDFPIVRDHLSSLHFYAVGSGEVWDRPATPDEHQNWGLDVAAQRWRIDVMLESGDAHTWTTRRHPSITAPRTDIVGRTADGIPYLRPEATLLYKAKATRPKDEADLEACLPHLDDAAKAWLVDALSRAHPGHGWIDRVARATG